jgi:hypothetical protein
MPQDGEMADGGLSKIEQWARWTIWPAAILTVAALALLLFGASEAIWRWFLPAYLVIGMPTIAEAFVRDWTRLRRMWRYWRGETDDWA